MAYYKDLRRYQQFDGADKQSGQSGAEKADWIAQHLLRLRQLLIGKKAHDDIGSGHLGARRANSLVIGSWNIRGFDEGALRLDESYHYIAEIIDKFDICAVQEIKRDLRPLERLIGLLGPDWDYLVTDVVEGNKGNNERLAFLYNRNKVRFRSVVGKIVLSDDALIDHNGHKRQIARTPFFASFQAGWFRFTLVSTHILFGDDQRIRARELDAIAKLARQRSIDSAETYILIGDMNIKARDDQIYQALSANGFSAPDFGATNLGGDKDYDQIAFSGADQADRRQDKTTRLLQYGAIDWRKCLYLADESDQYRRISATMRAAEGKEAFRDWDKAYHSYFMTFEMSDHLPIWVEIETDYSADYLEQYVQAD